MGLLRCPGLLPPPPARPPLPIPSRHGAGRARAQAPGPPRPPGPAPAGAGLVPLALGELAEGLAQVVEGAVGLRLGGDALRPRGAGPDVRAGHGQHGLALVQPPLQLLDLLVLVRQALLQLADPLLLQQQQLGEVALQLAHGAGPLMCVE